MKDEQGTKAISLLIGLAKYGKQNCSIVIVEGILYSEIYRELFEVLKSEYKNIYAYYYDIPFKETIARHQTKTNCNEFGENEMKRWWRERDYIGIIPERSITDELSLEEVVEIIFSDVMSK
ncbi:MAG: kinase [Bacteroidales bacterium]|nr:kinase [Bacteroidales bacterium]